MRSPCGDILGMRVVEGISKYMGLPMSAKGSKTKMFQWIENKAHGKI